MDFFAVPAPGQANSLGALVFVTVSAFMVMAGWLVLPHILGWFSFVGDLDRGMEGFIFLLVVLAFYVGLR